MTSARDAYALTLAARQTRGHALEQVADAEQFRRLRQIDTALRRGHAFESVAQILLHTQMRKQARFLKDVAKRPLVGWQEDVAFSVEPHFAVDDESPLRDGRASPARQRSKVVLPEPEWPKIAVTPRLGIDTSRSSVKPLCSTRKRASMTSS